MTKKLSYDILIGIITRNVDKYLGSFLPIVDTYISLFNTSKVLFVDGFSNDNTVKIIDEWCSLDRDNRKLMNQYTYMSKHTIFNRGPSIAEARNIVIQQFTHLFNKNTLLLLIDADSPNSTPFDINGFLTAFEPNFPEWVGVFPSQKKEYYDIFALRDVNEPRIDKVPLCFENCQIEIHKTKDLFCYKKYQTPHPYEIGYRKVKSAFGGAALYKTEYICFKCVYNCYELFNQKPFPSCEHVSFNLELGKKGNLYINTKWIIGEHQ